MSLTWSTIPHLPLKCILHHLSTEDAMAAMSTCRHWRSALYVYEGRRDLLKLKAKYLEQCMFLTRIFKKRVKKLHIYLDCNEPEIDKFMDYVFIQYFDTVKLQELVFIGPSYVQQSMHLPFIKLRRMIIETLVYKNVKCIKKLSFMGCGLAAVRNDNERYSHKNLEIWARPLKFCSVQTAADTVLSSVNLHLMQISSLSHVSVDYEQISTVVLQTLSKLPHFRFLTLTITSRRYTLRPIDWDVLQNYYRCQLRVSLYIIGVPFRRFDAIIDNVLIEGLRLISLKVMFCKSLYTPMLSHISRVFQTTLTELLWVDTPYDSTDPYHRIVRPTRQPQVACILSDVLQMT
uniref:F-box domain-containing protein n=1 Tax=Heliothis virescens TaxID=7102 RepID=A0A2A4IVY4_HELVI